MAVRQQQRQSFTLPGAAGTYAPEELQLVVSAGVPPYGLLGLSLLVESAPASAVFELWVLRVGGQAGTAGDWIASGKSLTSGFETWPLASVGGVKIRAKSGGAAGTGIASAWAD